jgi:sensor domain CHASE-containing protein
LRGIKIKAKGEKRRMKGKKGVSIFLVLLFALSLMIAGCGETMQLDVEKQGNNQQQEEQLQEEQQ